MILLDLLTLPSGGWVGLTTNYTLTDSSGSVVDTGDITSTTTLNPSGLLEGNLTLDVLTTDSLGKSQSQNWTYYVDSSNNQSPIISIDGLNLTSSNVTWIGVGSVFMLTSISDDSNGVGANTATCSWDESNWFNVGASDRVMPNTASGVHENHTLTCKNVDILGNEGPSVQFNSSSDRITPFTVRLPKFQHPYLSWVANLGEYRGPIGRSIIYVESILVEWL